MTNDKNVLILDRIRDFEDVIKFYNQMLELITKLRPNIEMDELREELEEYSSNEYIIPIVRTIVSTESLNFFLIEEELSMYKIGNKKLNEIFEKSGIADDFELIEEGNELSKIKQLRNCLAHAMYEIKIVNQRVFVHINNGNITGDIAIEKFIELSSKYKEIFTEFTRYSNVGLLQYDISKLNDPNETQAINKFANSIRISGKELSKERLKEIKKWLKNIVGIRNIRVKSRDPQIRKKEQQRLYNTMLYIVNTTKREGDDIEVFIPTQIEYTSALAMFALGASDYWEKEDDEYLKILKEHEKKVKKKDYESFSRMAEVKENKKIENVDKYEGKNQISDIKQYYEEVLTQLSSRRPLLYAKEIISLANYTLNYATEINKYRRSRIFDYLGIDLQGINVKFVKSNEDIEQEVDLEQRLNKVSRRKRPEIENQIQKYGKNAKDSYNFFRHLRISIAHNNYKISYNKYLNTKKLEDILFSFYNYSITSGKLEFEVEISAKQLLRLIKEIEDKVNDGIETTLDGKAFEGSCLKEALVYRGINTADISEKSIVEEKAVKRDNREGDER